MCDAIVKICAACGAGWVTDDSLFITCPKCRKYDLDKRSGCGRYDAVTGVRPGEREVSPDDELVDDGDRDTDEPKDGDEDV